MCSVCGGYDPFRGDSCGSSIMRILADQDVYKITIDKLKEWKQDIVTAKDLGMDRASDEELLLVAKETERLLITRDKDFGALVCLKEEVSPGVILLRGSPKEIENIHHQLRNLLQEYVEDELKSVFCVVEPRKYRIRHL